MVVRSVFSYVHMLVALRCIMCLCLITVIILGLYVCMFCLVGGLGELSVFTCCMCLCLNVYVFICSYVARPVGSDCCL